MKVTEEVVFFPRSVVSVLKCLRSIWGSDIHRWRVDWLCFLLEVFGSKVFVDPVKTYYFFTYITSGKVQFKDGPSTTRTEVSPVDYITDTFTLEDFITSRVDRVDRPRRDGVGGVGNEVLKKGT